MTSAPLPVNFTFREKYLVSDIISRVIDCMKYDSSDGVYYDCGNFLLSLSKSELQILKRAYRKL